MSAFVFMLFCIQTCITKSVFGQCGGVPYGDPLSWSSACGGIAPLGFPEPWTLGPALGAYGGTGVGDVAVAGELPVAGTTFVAGQVPILGAVEFGGIIPAAGFVTISGICGCGCHLIY